MSTTASFQPAGVPALGIIIAVVVFPVGLSNEYFEFTNLYIGWFTNSTLRDWLSLFSLRTPGTCEPSLQFNFTLRRMDPTQPNSEEWLYFRSRGQELSNTNQLEMEWASGSQSFALQRNHLRGL